ncbi:arylsulfatase G-like [Alosa alosa]|uniref:arylsulfatase G-like n=1 Tax=Alosa alosa TaxID=278164 RepID=UPI0020153A8D|nr:arylsulfatase G-like [Alosa alosa]
MGFVCYLGVPYSNGMGCTDRPGSNLPPCYPCEGGSQQSSERDQGCNPSVPLPLYENQSIIEQPLDLWSLTEKYTSAAVRILHSARYCLPPLHIWH